MCSHVYFITFRHMYIFFCDAYIHTNAVVKHYDPSYSRSMKVHMERFNPPLHRVVLSGLSPDQLEREWFTAVDRNGVISDPSATSDVAPQN